MAHHLTQQIYLYQGYPIMNGHCFMKNLLKMNGCILLSWVSGNSMESGNSDDEDLLNRCMKY